MKSVQHTNNLNNNNQQFGFKSQYANNNNIITDNSNNNYNQLQQTIVQQKQPSPFFIKSNCEIHPEEHITNFCNNYNCLQALCPDCIEQHISFHKQNNSFPDIESIKLVKQNCNKKIKTASQQLVTQLEELENKNLFLAKDFQDEGILTLQSQRQNVLDIVNQYFDNLENKYKERINEFSNKGYQMNTLLEKIKNLLNELEFFQANLESPNQINTIKKVCSMDLRKMLEEFQTELKNIDSEQNMYSIDVNINSKRLDYIQQELFRYTNLGVIQDMRQNGQQSQIEINYEDNSHINNQQNIQNSNFQQMSTQQNQMQTDTEQFFIPHKIPQQQQVVQSKIVSQEQYQQEQLKQVQQNHPYSPSSSKYNTNIYNHMNLKDIDKKFQGNKVLIQQKDFFQPICNQKYLHFFQCHNNILHICDLEKLQNQKNQIAKFEEIKLPQNIQVREFHKTLITEKGQIFLIGGRINANKRSNEVYQFDYSQNQLIQKSNMIEARSSHGMVYLNGYIYVIGGFMDEQQIKGTCERYDIINDKWEQIASLLYPIINPAVCVFRNQYILKFGGLGDKLVSNNTIEIYDINQNTWNLIDASFSQDCTTKILSNFRLLNTSCAIQINQNEIYVFGGYNENKESSQTFIFAIEEDEQNQIQAEIRQVNQTPLIYPEGFWNNNPVIFQNNIYALQNINNNQTQQCIENARVVLKFDGQRWQEINMLT